MIFLVVTCPHNFHSKSAVGAFRMSAGAKIYQKRHSAIAAPPRVIDGCRRWKKAFGQEPPHGEELPKRRQHPTPQQNNATTREGSHNNRKATIPTSTALYRSCRQWATPWWRCCGFLVKSSKRTFGGVVLSRRQKNEMKHHQQQQQPSKRTTQYYYEESVWWYSRTLFVFISPLPTALIVFHFYDATTYTTQKQRNTCH